MTWVCLNWAVLLVTAPVPNQTWSNLVSRVSASVTQICLPSYTGFSHTVHCNCLHCCIASACVLTTTLQSTLCQVRPSLSCYVYLLAAYISLDSNHNCEHYQFDSSATNTSKEFDTGSACLCVQQCGAMTPAYHIMHFKQSCVQGYTWTDSDPKLSTGRRWDLCTQELT